MPRVFPFVAALLVLSALPVRAQSAAPDDPSPHSEATLVAAVDRVEPGVPFDTALRLAMDPGWHSYWLNPGDSGMATTVAWTLPDGSTADAIRWPFPERIEVPPYVSYGYEGEVLLPVRVTPPATLAEGETFTLRAKADWLICADVCLPATQDVTLSLPVGAGTSPGPDAEVFAEAYAALPAVVEDWRVEAVPTTDGYRLHLVPPEGWTGTLDGAYFYTDTPATVEHAAPQPLTTEDDGFSLSVPRSEFATETATRLSGVLVAPEETTWDGTHRALAVDAPLGETVVGVEAGAGSAMPALWLTLVLAFLGGLILNLMPCVFPVLSIKILGFAQGRIESRRVIRQHGLVFGLGVLVSFWVLAGALLGFRAAGEQIGWGFQLQSPWFVGALALLMFGIGLNLAGVFEVGFGPASAGGRMDRWSGLGGAFWSGVLAVIVATPCTAPFMAASLGVALAQPAPLALLVFTALGAGMALPYVLLALFPRWIEGLPKPGPWMETLRQALAFPMFGAAVWLVWVFGLQTGLNGAALLLLAMTLLAMAAWLVGRWTLTTSPPRLRWITRGLAATAVVLALLLGAAGVRQQGAAAVAPGAEPAASDWRAYDPEAVAQLVADGQPVFVDFTAAWCLSCQANKAVALSTSAVEDAFRTKGVATFRADWTNQDPIIAAALERFGRSGVPLYVLYPGDARPPELLPELLTPGIVLDALNGVSTVLAGEPPTIPS